MKHYGTSVEWRLRYETQGSNRFEKKKDRNVSEGSFGKTSQFEFAHLIHLPIDLFFKNTEFSMADLRYPYHRCDTSSGNPLKHKVAQLTYQISDDSDLSTL